MKKTFVVVFISLIIGSCTVVDHEFDELLPRQVNLTHEESLEIIVLAESTQIERNINAITYKLRTEFPPRIIISLSAPEDQFQDKSITLTSVELKRPDGTTEKLLEERKVLTLRDIFYPNGNEYGEYGHLKYRGGSATAIYFSEWIEDIRLNEKYTLDITFIDFDGDTESLQIPYEAVKTVRHAVGPSIWLVY